MKKLLFIALLLTVVLPFQSVQAWDFTSVFPILRLRDAGVAIGDRLYSLLDLRTKLAVVVKAKNITPQPTGETKSLRLSHPDVKLVWPTDWRNALIDEFDFVAVGGQARVAKIVISGKGGSATVKDIRLYDENNKIVSRTSNLLVTPIFSSQKKLIRIAFTQPFIVPAGSHHYRVVVSLASVNWKSLVPKLSLFEPNAKVTVTYAMVKGNKNTKTITAELQAVKTTR